MKRYLGFIIILTLAVALSASHVQFALKRTVPLNQPNKIKQLVAQDKERQALIIFNNSVNFPLQGSVNTIRVYTITVKLGTLGEEFTLQVDTGSSVVWVTSSSCGENCTRSTPGRDFNLKKSSTAKIIPCSKKRDCHFNPTYGDGAESAGYYVEDVLHLNVIHDKHKHNGAARRIMFGLSTSQVGQLAAGDRAIDGIFGLGTDYMSPIMQLSSLGVAPRVFSHCLSGDGEGGGSLVIGKVLDLSQTLYNVDLLKIGVNGRIVEIDSSIFAKSTYVDCGSFLAYLPSVAYDALFSALTEAVSDSTTSVAYDVFQHCYPISHGNVNEIFPLISLHFAGDVSMMLKPNQYLLNVGVNYSTGDVIWCCGFAKALSTFSDCTLLGGSLPMNVSDHYETSRGGKSSQMTPFKAFQVFIITNIIYSVNYCWL